MEVRNLKAYLANIRMTASEFAQIVQCSPSYIHQLANETAIPSRRIAKDIYHATDGVIQLTCRTPKRRPNRKKDEPQGEILS
jgi:hypothetical protein